MDELAAPPADPSAALPGPESEVVESRPLLVFQVASGWFAIDATASVEVTDLGDPVPVPRGPAHVPGLIFPRGHAVALLDLENFLQLAVAKDSRDETMLEEDPRPERVVVVAAADMRVGIRSHWVRGVFDVPLARFQPPDALAERVRCFSSAQVDHELGLLAVLDLPPLLRAARPGPALK